jgi:hypothetical protein
VITAGIRAALGGRAAFLACPSELIEIANHEGTLIAKELGLT